MNNEIKGNFDFFDKDVNKAEEKMKKICYWRYFK